MQRLFVIVLFSIPVFLFSCKREKTELLDRINVVEKNINKDSLGTFNKGLAIEASDLYIDFVNKFPDDEKAPDMLFKAANINNRILLFEQAVLLCKKLYVDYPEHKKAPVCLFLSAFISENYLHNLDKAKTEYTEFLDKYPHHELAKDARFSIQHLGKSDLELIKEFKSDSSKISVR